MPIDFYCLAGSPPCAVVKLAAQMVGAELNPIPVDLWTGEHMKPEFLAINPLHTVPAIRDNDLTLIESRAILMYLFDKYGNNSSYIPKEPKQRALVEQMLFFDMGVLYGRFADYYYPTLFHGAPKDDGKIAKINEALKCLEVFLQKTAFVAGDTPTLADITIGITISTYEAMRYDMTTCPKILAYFERCKKNIPGFSAIVAQNQKEFIDSIDTFGVKK